MRRREFIQKARKRAQARQNAEPGRQTMKSFLLAGLLLLGLTMTAQSVQAADVRMYIRHEVNDYTTWRKSYDAFNAERKRMGVAGAAVYRSVDNPNDVTVTHDFKSADK